MKSPTYESDGVSFKVTFSKPSAYKNSKTPCRGLATPLHPQTGKPITKRQLYGKESDCPVEKPLYGKNPQDILKNQMPGEAAALVLKMRQCGILCENAPAFSEAHDLAQLAVNFKETFFLLHRREWSEQTNKAYRQQYDILTQDLQGYIAEKLTQDIYEKLQENICRSALSTTRKKTDWNYGDAAPASAQKRMNLLYLLLWDLKGAEGYKIPLIPVRYAGKPSRQDLLLERIDNARSIPYAEMQRLCGIADLAGQAGILADCGLRISENVGLLCCSLHAAPGSQGLLYYVSVTGQIEGNGKRTEIPKTNPSYRIVPLSVELGERLARQIEQQSSNCGDISLMLLCGQENDGEFNADKAVAAAYASRTSKEIPELLQQKQIVHALTDRRAYTFDRACQNKHLTGMLTCHALRRNFCTDLYGASGLSTEEIYQQMGHAQKSEKKYRSSGSLPPDELYRMCLKKLVSRTPYHAAQPLRYHAGQHCETEVPSCKVELTLPAKSKYELTIQDTEPGNTIQISGEKVCRSLLRQEPRRDTLVSYALLAEETMYTILEKRKPFRAT